MTTGAMKTFPTGTLGVDKTGAPIPASSALELYQLGYRFAMRSIGVPNVSSSQNGALTTSEITDLWNADLSVGIFQLNFLQTTISAEQGTTDGQYMANQAASLGFPQNKGFILWFDLEGNETGASADVLQAYINAWASAVIAGGYAAGLYNGKQYTLSGQIISDLPNVHAYWQAGGYVPAGMPLRGYQMVQLWPLSQTIAGTRVDIDVLEQDFKNGKATFWGPETSPNQETQSSTGVLWTPPAGTVGLDRSDTIATKASALYDLGYRFAIRTVGLRSTSPGVLTASEVSAILDSGMALGIYQVYDMNKNYIQSASQGTNDGQYAASQAAALGAPPGLVIWYDFEVTYSCSQQVMTDYLNNWAAAVTGAGFAAGMYIGGQNLLPSTTLSNLPQFHSYWMAAAAINNPGGIARGFQMYQLLPYSTTTPIEIIAAGINIDGDVVQTDKKGSLPTLWKKES